MLKRVLIIGPGLVVAIFGIAIIFGGPRTPHPMGSIIDPFSSVDFSDLPQLSRFTARDGTKLAYRSYALATSAPGEGSVVLIHGSSATSSSMHPMAKELSAAGFTTYALDIRGHGGSGDKGQIGYIGQLEDDLTDFMRAVSPPAPVTLAGFSSGGGFALPAGSFSRLFVSGSVSQSGCTESTACRWRLGECWCSAHHRACDFKWIRSTNLQFAPSPPLCRERKHKDNFDLGIFLCAGNQLSAARRLSSRSPQHASAFPHSDRRERRSLLSKPLRRGSEAGRERCAGDNCPCCRSHTLDLVAAGA